MKVIGNCRVPNSSTPKNVVQAISDASPWRFEFFKGVVGNGTQKIRGCQN